MNEQNCFTLLLLYALVTIKVNKSCTQFLRIFVDIMKPIHTTTTTDKLLLIKDGAGETLLLKIQQV